MRKELTMELTNNQTRAMTALIKSCLGNMGGKTLADLQDDPFTWVDASDLVLLYLVEVAQAQCLDAISQQVVNRVPDASLDLSGAKYAFRLSASTQQQ